MLETANVGRGIRNQAVITSLPLEIHIQIYSEIDCLSDAISLSSTCHTLRAVYDYDCRIRMQTFPYALELLQLQRPGALPAWKEKRLRQSGIRSILNPLKLSTITDNKLSKIGETLDGKSSWQRLVLNHGFMERSVQAVARFRRRDKFDIKHPQLLNILFPQPWLMFSYMAPGVDIQLSPTEKFRVINATYMALAMQLQTLGFRPYTNTRKRSCTPAIPDYVSVFSLDIRKCLELIVFIRVCILECQNCHNSVRSIGAFHFCPGQTKFPIFWSKQLQQMLAMVVNIRYTTLKMLRIGGMGGGERYISRFCQQFNCLSDISHPLRSIFFDENQAQLSAMFANLNHELDDSNDPDIQVLLPLAPKSNEEAMKEYASSITNLCKRINMKGKLDFRAVRVDKDGVISFDEKGVINDESAGGRWGIFKKKDLRGLHKLAPAKKALGD